MKSRIENPKPKPSKGHEKHREKVWGFPERNCRSRLRKKFSAQDQENEFASSRRDISAELKKRDASCDVFIPLVGGKDLYWVGTKLAHWGA